MMHSYRICIMNQIDHEPSSRYLMRLVVRVINILYSTYLPLCVGGHSLCWYEPRVLCTHASFDSEYTFKFLLFLPLFTLPDCLISISRKAGSKSTFLYRAQRV